nr:Chain A, Envelope small membrane protein [Severe acute respiratory syndrome coronavirus 2]7K3G_B Chain B, Envelope small membrane protein [Severe acute respiratory syndrome coronavirus 2]7K3G_C Chain C, Envelope small membrane protein [Severe acute respiratory syndrome coronavirus 2]7K3G_D Chain D, Envelope small membrane protein [Severe acute respiratory syndrome coronavirus 2]7K3G_E Chain E, Envelope small membrane protein [Severe acute respiratory syndrome coronavirus 2]8SUZ_A Chain A, E
ETGTLIVNSVLLFLAFVVFLLVTLAILTALR